ncbi:MAG: hypothetical protein ABIJ21_03290 [Nanoarchaeota archaeon]
MADILNPSQRLVKHGFIKKEKKSFYKKDDKRKIWLPREGEIKAEHAEEEIAEEVNVTPSLNPNAEYLPTGFPPPYKRYRLIMEAFNQSIEEPYFWILGHMRQDLQFPYVDKITDIFSASENSAFFGQSAQRLGIQQDRASQYLATIGKLTKDIFPLVRELRVMDERLDLYNKFMEKEPKKGVSKAADVTLKGIFIDFAEGGTKNPSSVYGLSQQVGFTILPDLFFNTLCYEEDTIDEIVDAMQWNPQVKNLLKRKLYQYILWVKRTKQELENRRKFTLKYLRQHWHIVRMYISWVKPYLRTTKRLMMNEQQLDSPDLIGAFETSMTEIEILARKKHSGDMWQVVLATFAYRTKPAMQYRQDYQQGPVHVGRVQFDLRCYGWTQNQIDAYKRMKQDEELDMLGLVDASLKDAMDAFGDEIQQYLVEAGEQEEKEEKKEEKKEKPAYAGIHEPFVALFGGFAEMFGPLIPLKKRQKKEEIKGDSKKAAIDCERSMFLLYKNFKKAHGMMAP